MNPEKEVQLAPAQVPVIARLRMSEGRATLTEVGIRDARKSLRGRRSTMRGGWEVVEVVLEEEEGEEGESLARKEEGERRLIDGGRGGEGEEEG